MEKNGFQVREYHVFFHRFSCSFFMFRIARSMRCSAFPVENLRAPKFFDEFSEGESTYDEAGFRTDAVSCDLTRKKKPCKTNMDIPNIAIFESI